jgi:hypothetical protein
LERSKKVRKEGRMKVKKENKKGRERSMERKNG